MSDDHGDGGWLPHYFTLKHWVHYFGGQWNVSDPLIAIVIYTALMAVLWTMISNLPLFIFLWGLGMMPIWAPITLVCCGTMVFFHANRAEFTSAQTDTAVLLEFKIPKSIIKSPRAMEVVYNSLMVSAGETTMFDRAWSGSMRSYWSFEIVSLGGEIHFYFWTWKRYRSLVEAAFYGQYPELEIVEVEDYALQFYYDHHKYKAFVGDQMKMPAGTAKPFRTYVDFDLDWEMRKEEQRVDPSAQVFEVLGSMRPHEQVWLQMLFRPADGVTQEFVHWPLMNHPDDYGKEWITKQKNEVERVRKDAALIPGKEPDHPSVGFPHPTWIQQMAIKNLERNMAKVPFQVLIRSLYIADVSKGPFDGVNYTAVRWIFKPFNAPKEHPYYCYIRSRYWHNPFDFGWQDFWDYRWNHVTHHYIDAYKRRSAFGPPHISVGGSDDKASPTMSVMYLTSEEMATLFRFPHDTVKSPGLQRVEVKTALPPGNLPR